jgi:hypothetical protein
MHDLARNAGMCAMLACLTMLYLTVVSIMQLTHCSHVYCCVQSSNLICPHNATFVLCTTIAVTTAVMPIQMVTSAQQQT